MMTSSRLLRNTPLRGYFLALLMATTLLRPLPVLACTTDQDPDPDDWTTEDTTEDTTQDPTTDEVATTADTSEDPTTEATTDEIVTLDPFEVTAYTEEPTTYDWGTTEWETTWETSWDETTEDETTYPDSTTTCDCDSCANPNYAGTPNQFSAFDGNAKRQIDDFQVVGARGRFGLKFARFHNTHSRGGAAPFGGYSNWRHSWQYDLTPIKLGGQPAFEFVEPSGLEVVLHAAGPGRWMADPGRAERAYSVADGIRLELAGGVKVFFRTAQGANGATRFEARTVTDSLGFVTRLAYDENGNLARVTEPGGKYITFKYQKAAYDRVPFDSTLANFPAAPAPGQWSEASVPAGAKSYQYVRVRTTSGEAAVAELQFVGADGSIINGEVFAMGANAKPAADGNHETSTTLSKSNFIGTEVNAANQVLKVRVLAAAGHESELSRLVVEGAAPVTATRMVVSEVASSDGQVVKYRYANARFPYIGAQVSLLTRADYEDGSAAQYKYAFPQSVGARPQLLEADDPRFNGRAKQVRYTYHDSKGTVHEEMNPETGAIYASLELDHADPHKRIVRYSDLKQEVFKYDNQNRLVEKTDAVGRTTKWEYGRDGKGPATARVDHAGRRTEWTTDSRGRVLTTKIDGETVGTVERDAKAPRLTRSDRHGRTISLAYVDTARGKAKRIEHADHTVEEHIYDKHGRVAEIRTRDGRKFTYTYDTRGNKATQADSLGNVTKYEYDSRDRLIGVIDPTGRASRYEYNSRNQITKETRVDGTGWKYTYDRAGRKNSITDQFNRTTHYTFDVLGRLRQQVDADGNTTRLEYADLPEGCGSCSLAPQPTRIQNPDGTIETRVYDSVGRLLCQTVAVGTSAQATTTYAYDSDDNVTAITDSLGRTTRYSYDDHRNRVTMTDATGRITKWTYDEDGHVLTATAPDGGVTRNEYDSNGRLIHQVDPDGNHTKYSYDSAGRVATLVDAQKRATQYSYDANGRKMSVRYDDGKEQKWTYDAAGQIATTTNANGLTTALTRDNAGRIISTSDSLGRTYQYRFDEFGNKISATDPLGHTTRWTYDAQGHQSSLTKPDGSVVRYGYDVKNRQVSAEDAQKHGNRVQYDDGGNVARIIDSSGNAYGFEYDALHRRTAVLYPDGTSEKWTYDAAGNVIKYATRGNQTKTTTYNLDDRPISETWSPAGAAPNCRYEYDVSGRLAKIDNGLARLSYSYSPSGKIISETTDLGQLVPNLAPDEVKYAYDGSGNMTSIAYPSKTQVNRVYDVVGRVVTVESAKASPVAEYTYTVDGQVAGLRRGNRTETEYKYDSAGRVATVRHRSGATTVALADYTRDEAGRPITQMREDGVAEKYEYDPAGELVAAIYDATSGRREDFAYDGSGNRQSSAKAKGPTTTYVTNPSNQYTQVQGTTFTYDANGNLTSDGRNSYAYDAANRLVAVASGRAASGGNAFKIELYYDGRSRCILRRHYTLDTQGRWVTDDARTAAYTYDTDWNLLSERGIDGKMRAEYIHGIRRDEVLVAKLAGNAYFPLADALGSTVALTDDSGQVVRRYRYDAFGTPETLAANYARVDTSSIGYRFLFTGREWLAASGLNDHRYRHYSPALGRWISADPARFPQSANGVEVDPNLYSYVRNRVLEHNDPMGLSDCTPGAETFGLTDVEVWGVNNCNSSCPSKGSYKLKISAGITVQGASLSVEFEATIDYDVPARTNQKWYGNYHCTCKNGYFTNYWSCIPNGLSSITPSCGR